MSDQIEQKGNIFIGEGVTVSGTFSIPGRAVVNGTLNGELSADELMVGKQGRLAGQITVRNADVHGETNDTVTASSRLIVRSTGRVNGRASYGELEIERGGLVAGTIVPVNARSQSPEPTGLPVLSVVVEAITVEEPKADSSGQ